MEYARETYPSLLAQLDKDGSYNDEIQEDLASLLEKFKKTQTW